VILDSQVRQGVRDAFLTQPQHRDAWKGSGA